jgi:penicillin V acylase-like amidase (Ntn superfamily)
MKTEGKSISSKKIVGIIIPTILIILQSIFYFIYGHISFVNGHFDKATISNQAPESCTILTASQGDKVLFGNNEDWINPNTYYWTVPPTADNFGVVYFGFDDFRPQGGVNEKGLAFDVNALPKSALNPHPELPKIDYPFYKNLEKYSTVEEVINAVKSYSWEKHGGLNCMLRI